MRIVTSRTWLVELFTPFGAVRDDGSEIDPESSLASLRNGRGSRIRFSAP